MAESESKCQREKIREKLISFNNNTNAESRMQIQFYLDDILTRDEKRSKNGASFCI